MHPAIPTDIVSLKYQCTPLYLTPRMVRPDSISCTVLHTLLFPRPGQTAYRLAMRLGAFLWATECFPLRSPDARICFKVELEGI